MIGSVLESLSHFFGIDNLSGPFYGFWSGIGSDLGELAIFGGVVQLYRRHNCHVKGCWRIGHHAVEGTPYVVCPQHHPDIKGERPTHEQLLEIVRKRRAAS